MLSKTQLDILDAAYESNPDRPILILGDEQTGVSSLWRQLKKHGYNAIDPHEIPIIYLTRSIKDEMVRNLDDYIK